MTDLLQGSELLAADGRRVRLGRRIGQGGEGTVFDLDGEEGLVAKVFREPLSLERADKIAVMASLSRAAIDAVTAWPIELLSLPSGEPIGLTLPRITDAHELHQLYSPKSRRLAFPAADWRFLVRVAANLSHAVAAVHAGSIVVADLNPSGMLVDQEGRVRLIDCDSFQIEAPGKRFLCDVGVAAFTPPELQGRPFAGLARSPDHDNFGLAVLAFLLLFMGRHPFAGRFLGLQDMPVERAIAEHRFAFGAAHRAVEMEPPPGAPALAIASPRLAALFEKAFAADAADKGRPSAQEWALALDELQAELVGCNVDLLHWHWRGLSSCPWCAMEAATGVPLFAESISPLAAGLFDMPEFWRLVEAVEHPGPAPAVDWNEPVSVSDDVRSLRRRWMFQMPIALLVAIIPVFLVFAVDAPALAAFLALLCAIPLFLVVRRLQRSVGDTSSLVQWMLHCRDEWETARREWNAKAGPGAFQAKRKELDDLRAAWESSADPMQRQSIEGRLRRALEELHKTRNQIVFARTSLREKCELAHRTYLQSEADLRAIGS